MYNLVGNMGNLSILWEKGEYAISTIDLGGWTPLITSICWQQLCGI